MKKFVSLISVDGHWERFRLFAENKEQAKENALATYKDYQKDGFIKEYSYIRTWEVY